MQSLKNVCTNAYDAFIDQEHSRIMVNPAHLFLSWAIIMTGSILGIIYKENKWQAVLGLFGVSIASLIATAVIIGCMIHMYTEYYISKPEGINRSFRLNSHSDDNTYFDDAFKTSKIEYVS